MCRRPAFPARAATFAIARVLRIGACMRYFQRMTTRQRQGAGSRQTASYRALIGIAEEVAVGARKALDDTAAMRGKAPLTALKIEALRDEIAHYCDLGTRVIEQARRPA